MLSTTFPFQPEVWCARCKFPTTPKVRLWSLSLCRWKNEGFWNGWNLVWSRPVAWIDLMFKSWKASFISVKWIQKGLWLTQTIRSPKTNLQQINLGWFTFWFLLPYHILEIPKNHKCCFRRRRFFHVVKLLLISSWDTTLQAFQAICAWWTGKCLGPHRGIDLSFLSP